MTPLYRIRKLGSMWTVERFDYGERRYQWSAMFPSWVEALRWVTP